MDKRDIKTSLKTNNYLEKTITVKPIQIQECIKLHVVLIYKFILDKHEEILENVQTNTEIVV